MLLCIALELANLCCNALHLVLELLQLLPRLCLCMGVNSQRCVSRPRPSTVVVRGQVSEDSRCSDMRGWPRVAAAADMALKERRERGGGDHSRS